METKVWRGHSMTEVTFSGGDSKTTHYLNDDEVDLLVVQLRSSQRPHWVFASRVDGPFRWECSHCRRQVEGDEKPEPCDCRKEAINGESV